MEVIRTVRAMREWRAQCSDAGLVPTMGALHEGHLSLVRAAKKENEKVVVSIFVNPLQFLPGEDFTQYPRDEERDLQLLRAEGVDCVFIPSVEEIYPKPPQLSFACPALTNVLCGKSRPGHFEGVMLVVSKLLNIVQPQSVYFGQKDYQQCLVIQNLLQDLSLEINFHMMPIVREADGLALSSRNIYLSAEEREEAVLLNRALQEVVTLVQGREFSVEVLSTALRKTLRAPSIKIDYAEVLTADSLQRVEFLTKGRYVVALAVFVGKTRLIDNLLLDVK